MNQFSIYDYDIFNEDEVSEYNPQSWLVEVPCSVEDILELHGGTICVINNIQENKKTLIKVCLVRPFDDLVYVDPELDEQFSTFKFLGSKLYNNRRFYIFTKIIGKKEREE